VPEGEPDGRLAHDANFFGVSPTPGLSIQPWKPPAVNWYTLAATLPPVRIQPQGEPASLRPLTTDRTGLPELSKTCQRAADAAAGSASSRMLAMSANAVVMLILMVPREV
jgi:hypothetical protein